MSPSMVLAVVRSASSPFTGIHRFFQSTTWRLVETLTMLLLVAVWLAAAWWVLRDARRRVDRPWLVMLAGLLGLLPLVGPALYLLVRPVELLADVRVRELELRMLRQRLRGDERCPTCAADTDASFRVCPVCATELRHPCPACEALLEPLWELCPFCGTHVDSGRPETPAPALPLPELLSSTAPALAEPIGPPGAQSSAV